MFGQLWGDSVHAAEHSIPPSALPKYTQYHSAMCSAVWPHVCPSFAVYGTIFIFGAAGVAMGIQAQLASRLVTELFVCFDCTGVTLAVLMLLYFQIRSILK
jgi:hypothetical protein